MNKVKKKMALVLATCTLLTQLGSTRLYAQTIGGMDVWVQDSASRVFESTIKPIYPLQDIKLYSAKNEYEAAQILIRSQKALTDLSVEISDLIDHQGNILKKENITVFREYFHPSTSITGDIELAPDGSENYADALIEVDDEGPVSIGANKTQPYWIRVYSDTNQVPGSYTGTAIVRSNEGLETVPIEIEVYDVTLPKTNESEFKMNNWFGSVGWDYAGTQESIPKQYGVELYDDNWWRVIGNIANDLSTHRNNVIYIDFQALLIPDTTIAQDGSYQFGWDNFDRFIKIFTDAEALQYVYTPHLLEKVGAVGKLEMIKEVNGIMQRILVDCDTQESNEYLAQLLPALRSHLVELGDTLGIDLLNQFYISAMDEPESGGHVKTSKWFYEAVKKYFPEAQTAEAHHRNTKGLEEDLTTFVPKLNTYEENRGYYQDLLKNKDKELWLYACIGLDGDYLNRYLPYHLSKTRLFPWYVYQIGGSGFLHFGYNYWNSKDTFSYDQTGDEWLVRPNKEKFSIYTSIRHEAQLDGVEDFELLKMLEKQNSEAAKQIVDNIIKSGTEYIRAGRGVTKAHKLMLDVLTNKVEVAERIAIPVFEDTFDKRYDTAWIRNSGKWSVVDSTYQAKGTVNNTLCMSSAAGWNIGNGEVNFDLTIGDVGENGEALGAGVIIHKANINDTDFQDGYLLQLSKEGRLILSKGQSILQEVQIQVEPVNRITISNLNGVIEVYANGSEGALLTVKDKTYSQGYISLVSNGVDAIFDNIYLSSYDEFMKPNTDKNLIIDSGYRDYFNASSLMNWVTNEVVDYSGQMLHINGAGFAALSKRVFKDSMITFDMSFKEDEGMAGIAFRKGTQIGKVDDVGGYYLGISPNGEIQLKEGNIIIGSEKIERNLKELFEVQIKAEGQKISVWIDGSQVLGIEGLNSYFEEGFISFESENAEVIFDNLSISAADIKKEFDCIDDFSNGLDKWKVVADEGCIRTENGVLVLEGTNEEHGGKSPEVVLKDKIIGNGTLSFDMKIPTTQDNDDKNWAAITVRSQGDNGIWNSGGYLIHYRANGMLEVYGTEGKVSAVDTEVKPVEQFVNVSVEMKESEFRIFINHNKIPVLTFKDEKFKEGYISLKSDSATAEFDGLYFAADMEIIDDFTQENANWKQIKNPECIDISEGTLKIDGVTEKGDSPEIVLKDKVIQDGVISFDMKINKTVDNKDANWGGCYIRTGGDTGYWNHGGYLIYYRANGFIEVYSGGVIGSADTGLKPVDEFVNVRIEMYGSKLEIFINNGAKPIIEIENGNYEKGYFGLISDFANAEYDNIKSKGIEGYVPDTEGEVIQDEPYSDNFEDTTNWAPNLLGGEWSLKEGRYTGKSSLGNVTVTTLKDRKFTNASIAFDVELTSTLKDEWCGILLRKQTPKGECWNGCYMIYYTGEGDLKLYADGDVQGARKNIGYTGEKVNIRVDMEENILRVYADEELAFEYTDLECAYMDGYVSFCTYQSEASFDNLDIEILEAKPEEIIKNEVFEDNFKHNNYWKPVKLTGGEFSIVEETCVIKGTKDSEAATLLLKNRNYDNAVIEFDMVLTSESKDQWAGILLRKQNPATGCWDRSYMLYYNSEGELKLYGDGSRGDIAVSNIGYIQGEKVKIKVDMRGDTLIIYANSKEVLRYTDPEFKYQEGYIALCSYMSQVVFDNIKIVPYISIQDISDITHIVNQHEAYILPEVVEAKMSDRTTQSVYVIWNNKADTTVAGTYVFVGKVQDYDKDIRLKLVVLPPSIEEVEIAYIPDQVGCINQYEDFILPETVEAIMTDRTTQSVYVVWDGKVDTTIPGEQVLVGSVANYTSPIRYILTIEPLDLRGAYTVKYQDDKGNVIGKELYKDELELGKYTVVAKEIKGYNLIGKSERSIRLTPDNLYQCIVFIYKKENKEDNDSDDNSEGSNDNIVINKPKITEEQSKINLEHLIGKNPEILIDIEMHWASKEIKKIVEVGLMQGRTDIEFIPEGYLMRSEVAAILNRIINPRQVDYLMNFKDVKGTEWYAKDVATIVEMGIMKGCLGNIFNASAEITRGEVMSLIARLAKYYEVYQPPKEVDSILDEYKDNATIPNWIPREDIAWCIQEQIIRGAEHRLNVMEKITRAEMAVILSRILSGFNMN